MNRSRYQSGQAIVLVALLMMGLLAVAGLALDAGGLYFLNRNAQNAADAAAVAGAYSLCTNGDVASIQHAALDAAKSQGFNNNGSSNWITVNVPPVGGSKAGDPHYVEVIIRAEKPAMLIQLVRDDPLEITGRAVGYCGMAEIAVPTDDVYALFGGSTVCESPIDWPGSQNTVIGSVHSNRTYKQEGSNNSVTGYSSSVGNVLSMGSNNVYSGSQCTGPGCPITGASVQPMPVVFDINDFKPGGLFSTDPKYHNAGSTVINVGTLRARGWMVGSVIEPGIYYTTNNIVINENNIVADGVTFVTYAGTISLGGNNHVMNPYVGNLLTFSNAAACGCQPCNTTVIKLSGQGNQWNGIIYSPRAQTELYGTMTGTTLNGCIYGNNIRLNSKNARVVCQPDDTESNPAITIAE